MAGRDGESAELQGRLGISRSPEAGCHTNPRDSKPSASRPLARSGKQVLRKRRERAAMGQLLGEKEAGGEHCAVHRLYGECGRGESGSK